ncbi:hypothetical protein ACJX0J_035993 [Zea mays]
MEACCMAHSSSGKNNRDDVDQVLRRETTSILVAAAVVPLVALEVCACADIMRSIAGVHFLSYYIGTSRRLPFLIVIFEDFLNVNVKLLDNKTVWTYLRFYIQMQVAFPVNYKTKALLRAMFKVNESKWGVKCCSNSEMRIFLWLKIDISANRSVIYYIFIHLLLLLFTFEIDVDIRRVRANLEVRVIEGIKDARILYY